MPEPVDEDLLGSESDGGDEPATAGYKICIAVQGDGSFSVYQEPLSEPAEQPGPPEAGLTPSRTSDPLTSFEDALRAALQLYKQNPTESNAQDDLEAGYAAG